MSNATELHGLFDGWAPRSKTVLFDWLRQQGACIHDGLEVVDMESGSGWRVVSREDIETPMLLFSIPKTAVFSVRASSIPFLGDLLDTPATDVSSYLKDLAVCLLHEIRLGAESRFFGYLQSLPRDPREMLLPVFWSMESLAGDDGRVALDWLQGTTGGRELAAKAGTPAGLDGLEKYYTLVGAGLSPTASHPDPSPFGAFAYAYTILVTRAFAVDMYHATALVPFADLLNHSARPHTQLAADDFVCHACGSMARCAHDILDARGWPYRLRHLSRNQWSIAEGEVDTVEMRADRPVRRGEEVFNTYGPDLGDGKLLLEWGFIAEDYAGYGLTWTADEVASTANTIAAGAAASALAETIEWTNTKEAALATWQAMTKDQMLAAAVSPTPDLPNSRRVRRPNHGVRPAQRLGRTPRGRNHFPYTSTEADCVLQTRGRRERERERGGGGGSSNGDVDDGSRGSSRSASGNSRGSSSGCSHGSSRSDAEIDTLLCSPPSKREHHDLLNLTQEAQVCMNVFALAFLAQVSTQYRALASAVAAIQSAAEQVEACWDIAENGSQPSSTRGSSYNLAAVAASVPAAVEGRHANDESDGMGRARGNCSADDHGPGAEVEVEEEADEDGVRVDPEVLSTARTILRLLQDRLGGMYCPDASLFTLLDDRDNLGERDRYTRMAMTLSINERSLLLTAIAKWEAVIAVAKPRLSE